MNIVPKRNHEPVIYGKNNDLFLFSNDNIVFLKKNRGGR